MSPTIRHNTNIFTPLLIQRAKDRRQKFHFGRLPFDVRPRNVKLNLSNETTAMLLFSYVYTFYCSDKFAWLLDT